MELCANRSVHQYIYTVAVLSDTDLWLWLRYTVTSYCGFDIVIVCKWNFGFFFLLFPTFFFPRFSRFFFKFLWDNRLSPPAWTGLGWIEFFLTRGQSAPAQPKWPVLDPFCFHHYAGVIRKIQLLLSRRWSCQLFHILRESKFADDRLATEGASCCTNLVLLDEAPTWLNLLLFGDEDETV